MSTTAGSSASVLPSTTSTTMASSTDSRLSCPIRASGRSSQLSQVISRHSKSQSRKSMNRNMPPNAAICG